MGLREKYFHNSIYNVAGWGWSTILNIIIIPYMIYKLGYDQYGILSLVFLVVGYFAFLDLGLADAVVKYISHYYALNNIVKINNIINSILALFVIMGISGGIFILVFSNFVALEVFKIPDELHTTTKYCFNLCAIGLLLNLILGVIAKIPEALQRFDLSNRNNIIMGTAVSVMNVIVLFLGYGIKAIVLINILGSLFGIFLFYLTANKLIPQVVFNLKFNYDDFREVFHFGLYTVFTKFSSLMTNSINQLFIGSLVGASGLTIFNVPFKIISAFKGIIYRLSFVVFPVSSELSALEYSEKLESVYLKSSRYIFLLSSMFFIPVIAYSNKILLFWLGADFADKGTYLMMMISLALFFISLTMIPGLIALGLGKPKYNAIFSLVTAGANIIFGYPLTKMWGTDGAATALFISSLQFPIAVYVINRKVARVHNVIYFKMVFGKIALIDVFCIVLYSLVGNRLINGLTTLLAVLCLSCLILLLLGYRFSVERDDKKAVLGGLINIWSKVLGTRT